MNDLVYVVKQSSLSAYADDTQIFYADKDLIRVEENINADLSNVDNWYKENGMKRNVTPRSIKQWSWVKHRLT